MSGDRDQNRDRDRNRDRDTAGRARNARPRDAYGRPLPHGVEGEARVPDDYAAASEEALLREQALPL